jgi:hypothetical protein
MCGHKLKNDCEQQEDKTETSLFSPWNTNNWIQNIQRIKNGK